MLRNLLMLIATSTLALVVLVACGNGVEDEAENGEGNGETSEQADDSEQEDESEEMGAARTGDEGEPDPSGQTGSSVADEGIDRVSESVEVTLEDYEIQMENSAPVGILAFTIANDGEHEHGISVIPADVGDGNHEDSVIGSMNVEPGDEQQLELNLEEGEYTVFCPVEDHREEHGMETTLVVE